MNLAVTNGVDSLHMLYRLDRMIEGLWMAPELVVPEHCPYSQASSAILPRLGCSIERDEEITCLDLVLVDAVEHDFAWVVLSDAAIYTYGHTVGLNQDERWQFATWDGGVRRVFRATYAQKLPPSSIAALYGNDAADYARPDRLAIQLQLSRS